MEPLLLTSEGLYIYFPKSEIDLHTLKKSLAVSNRSLNSGNSERDVVDLLLGELDYKLLKIKREFGEVSSVFQHLACTMFINNIEAHLKHRVEEREHDDEAGYFFKMNIYGKRQQLVIFVKGMRAYLPACEPVTTVFLREVADANACYRRHMPILYVDTEGVNASGFLTSDMIIQPYAVRQFLEPKAKCGLKLYMNTSINIVQDANGSQFLNTVTSETVELPVKVGMTASLDLKELNDAYSHHERVSAGSNMLKVVSRIVANAEHDSNFATFGFQKAGSQAVSGIQAHQTAYPSLITRIGSAISNLKSSIFTFFAWIGISLILILILLSSIYCFFKFKLARNGRRNQVMTEMI
jgi:hypothetical protein